jgi:glyoxylase-like metal-dependent hydrolase (beta-lactamase superfamily II)
MRTIVASTLPTPALPPQVQVIVRDWLSANHVLLHGRDGAVLVDTGYVSHVPLTLALLEGERGLRGKPLSKIVNTHCHSDHMGGNAAIARAHGCPIAVPEGEMPLIEAWDEKALLLGYADQSAERFRAGEALRAGATYQWGDLAWQAIAAPGHDMGALCFHNAEHGILISGDALWKQGFGFVMPREMDPRALPATRATLEALARLHIRTVIPGHGEPFDDVDAALERAFRRLDLFEADPVRLVRHALKVVLTFKLLDARSLPLDGMAAYVERVGIYREFNDRFLRLSPADLATSLIVDLERTGAVRRENGRLVPNAPAAG